MSLTNLEIHQDIEKEWGRQREAGVHAHFKGAPDGDWVTVIKIRMSTIADLAYWDPYSDLRTNLVGLSAFLLAWIEFVDRKAGAEPRQPPFGTWPIGETKSEIEERKGGHDA